MKTKHLQYYMHDGSSAFRFELAGDLNGEGARRLVRDWRTASSVIGQRTLIVDMMFVTSADEEGRALLARWHADGAKILLAALLFPVRVHAANLKYAEAPASAGRFATQVVTLRNRTSMFTHVLSGRPMEC